VERETRLDEIMMMTMKTTVTVTVTIIIQSFITYVPSQKLQGQLQTQRSVDTGNYIMDKHNIKSKTNHRQALEENPH
jgi:hypothetical protein